MTAQKPSEIPDLYERLGVSRAASAAEVKNAYRQQACQWHPDAHPGLETKVEARTDLQEQFIAVSEAFEILSDPAKRQQYDATGSVASARTRTAAQAGEQRFDTIMRIFIHYQNDYGAMLDDLFKAIQGSPEHLRRFVDLIDL